MSGCLDLRDCTNEVYGIYKCENNLDAENFLLLNKDGTFEHIYREKDIELKHIGNWKRIENSCILEFSEWYNYNELGNNFEKQGNGVLWINRNFLDISPDGETETSFIKD
ncbi:hypothetical protein BTO06_06310 [Tenacibaculum sp. SZ-18]|uniref:hypothetical protein n=1 Tax=Tenacibaculum sp. SZ-18 TaxID=754423 RepID=UPI000C2D3B68|nr:hypothetical protein [Tenacibaculum sp. SZ-18]AUC14779.1 hypothetical protein BTO06_06310 [Tenacibaculum sp. SZ-18]